MGLVRRLRSINNVSEQDIRVLVPKGPSNGSPGFERLSEYSIPTVVLVLLLVVVLECWWEIEDENEPDDEDDELFGYFPTASTTRGIKEKKPKLYGGATESQHVECAGRVQRRRRFRAQRHVDPALIPRAFDVFPLFDTVLRVQKRCRHYVLPPHSISQIPSTLAPRHSPAISLPPPE